MKTATYHRQDGTELKVDYDENAPCIVCGEPVVEASMGGTVLCPWCDIGHCRYCKVQLPMGRDREDSTKKIREHIKWHKDQIAAQPK